MSDRPDNLSTAGAGLPAGTPASPGIGSHPMTLGEFELRREIGRGGMGTVYEAWQRSLHRTVAVKVLSRQVSASSTAVLRFQREAQAAAKLHHAHIVPIFALGEADGVYYYAMEYIKGPGLNAIIAETRERQTADTATSDLAETVALHRPVASEEDTRAGAETQQLPPRLDADGSAVTLSSISAICPSEEYFAFIARHIASIADALDYAHQNGVIHRDIKPHNLLLGQDGKLRISDFGLARLSEHPGVTMTGEMIGSPLYMSPEQISGDASKVDHRADIYSLGATMYEWLALTPPHPGETREGVISKVLTCEPLPLRYHNREIPVDLETICLKAIERDRHRRYQAAAEFSDDLRQFLARKPIRARRTNAATRARRFIRRHQLASLGVAAAVVALALGLALVTKEREVRTQTAVAEQLKEESDRVLDLLSLLPLEIGGPLRVAEAAVPMLGGVVQSGGPQDGVEQSVGADPSAVREPARLARRAAWEFLEASVPGGRPVADPNAPAGFSSLLGRAADRAQSEPRVAYELVDVYLQDYPDDFNARQLRAALGARLAEHDRMLEDAEALVRLRAQDPNAYIWRALAYLLAGLGERSLGDLDRAMRLDALSTWLFALRGLALAQEQRVVEAISAFDDALALDPDLVVALLGRAGGRAALGNIAGAMADLDQVLELEPDNADVLALRGDYHLVLAEFAAAERDFERAMNIAGRSPWLILRYLSAMSQHRSTTGGTTGGTTAEPGAPGEADDPYRDPKGAAKSDSLPAWLSRLLIPGRRTPTSTRPKRGAPGPVWTD